MRHHASHRGWSGLESPRETDPHSCYNAAMSQSSRASLPLFVFVSGKPGSGKSTLAQRLADALWFPLLSKDAIKQGLLETRAAAEDEAAREVDGPTSFGVFYGAIGFLLRSGVSLVAEVSFQRGLDEPKFQPLMEVARIVNVHCETSISSS
jgi:predicted kinase